MIVDFSALAPRVTRSVRGRSRWARALGLGVLIPVIVGSFLIGRARIADAQCIAQPEEGSWTNVNPATNSITRVVLRFTCQDQILNGQPYPPGPPWHIHIWGRCQPTDCDWGETGATRLSNQRIYGTYNQGYARRYVYAMMSQTHPGQLWVYIWTDFADPARHDYASQNYFHH